MSSVYTPAAVKLPGGVTIPADGTDYVTAASVNVPLCAALDGIAYNRGKVRRVYWGSLSDTTTAIGDVESNTYQDVILLTSAAAAVGENVNFHYRCQVDTPELCCVRLAVGPSRVQISGAAAWLFVGKSVLVLTGGTTLLAGHLNAGMLDVYLQIKQNTGSVSPTYISEPHWLDVEIIKP